MPPHLELIFVHHTSLEVYSEFLCVLFFFTTQSLRKLIEKEINPFVDEWEAAKSFPAHKVPSYPALTNLVAHPSSHPLPSSVGRRGKR